MPRFVPDEPRPHSPKFVPDEPVTTAPKFVPDEPVEKELTLRNIAFPPKPEKVFKHDVSLPEVTAERFTARKSALAEPVTDLPAIHELREPALPDPPASIENISKQISVERNEERQGRAVFGEADITQGIPDFQYEPTFLDRAVPGVLEFAAKTGVGAMAGGALKGGTILSATGRGVLQSMPWTVEALQKGEVSDALVISATSAFLSGGWKAIPASTKKAIGSKIMGEIAKNKEKLANMIGLTTKPIPEKLKKHYLTWLSEKKLREYRAGRYKNFVQRHLSKEEREAVTFLIEKTDVPKQLGRPDLEALVKSPTKRMRDIANMTKRKFQENWDYLAKNLDNLEGKEIENYVTHLWDVPKNKRADVANWFFTKNRFLKKRSIATYKEGIERFGLKPKTLDIADIYTTNTNVAVRATENLKFAEGLKKLQDETGMKLVVRSDKAPMGWKVYNHPALQRGMAVGKVEKQVPVKSFREKIIETIEKIKTVSKPTGKTVKQTGSKPVQKLESIITNSLESRGMTSGEAKAYLGRLKAVYAGADVVDDAAEDVLSETVKKSINRIVDEVDEIVGVESPIIVKKGVAVAPEIRSVMDAVFEGRLQAPGIDAYEAINSVLKTSNLTASMFHHTALTETGMAVSPKNTLKTLLNAKRIYRAVKNREFDVFKKWKVAEDAIRDGVEFGAISDVQKGRFDKLLFDAASGLEKINPVLGKPFRFLSKAKDLNDTVLWDYLHNNLKLYGYQTLKDNALRKSKNYSSANIQRVGREMAQFVNDTYGGQNWERLAVSNSLLDQFLSNPKTRQMAQWALLSPDWTYSTIKQALSPTTIGALSKETRGLRAKTGAKFWAKAVFWYGASMNMMNKVFSGMDEVSKIEDATGKELSLQEKQKIVLEKGKWMWENSPGHKTHLFAGRFDSGEEKYVRAGKQFRELPEMLYDMQANELSPVTASIARIGAKAAPLAQVMSTVFTGKSLGGFENAELKGKEGREKVGALLGYLAQTPMPMSIKGNKEFSPLNLALPTSKGTTYWKSRKLFKKELERENPRQEKIMEIFDSSINNGLNGWQIYNDAVDMAEKDLNAKTRQSLKEGKNSGTKREFIVSKKTQRFETLRDSVVSRADLIREGVKDTLRKRAIIHGILAEQHIPDVDTTRTPHEIFSTTDPRFVPDERQ